MPEFVLRTWETAVGTYIVKARGPNDAETKLEATLNGGRDWGDSVEQVDLDVFEATVRSVDPY